MRYTLLVALLALGAAPLAAQVEAEPPPRLVLSPFVGWRFGFDTFADSLLVENGTETVFVTNQEVDDGGIFGLEAEFAVWGPWSVVGSFAYGPGSDVLVTRVTEEDTEQFVVNDRSTILARVGAQFQFPGPDPLVDQRLYRPNAYLFAAPAFVRISGEGGSDEHIALNFGIRASGDIPWWDDIGFMLVGEDYWLVGNESDFTILTGSENAFTRGEIDQGGNHVLAFRAGLTWQVGAIR